MGTENWATWDEILPSNTCFSASIPSTLGFSNLLAFCLIIMSPPVLTWCILIYSIKVSAYSLKLAAFPVLYARKEDRFVFISSAIVCQLHTPQLFLRVWCCTALLQSPMGTWGSVWAKRNCAFLWNMEAYRIMCVYYRYCHRWTLQASFIACLFLPLQKILRVVCFLIKRSNFSFDTIQ